MQAVLKRDERPVFDIREQIAYELATCSVDKSFKTVDILLIGAVRLLKLGLLVFKEFKPLLRGLEIGIGIGHNDTPRQNPLVLQTYHDPSDK